MLAHRAYRVVLLLLVGLVSCVIHCRQFQEGGDIPPRCRELSVTPVSCAQPSHDNLLPHPDDCELFYYCVSPAAKPVCRQCPAQLHFNPQLHVCDHPSVAGCHDGNPSDRSTGGSTEETTATEATTTGVWYT